MATINYERKELVDIWDVDDVHYYRDDLSDEQALEVLIEVAGCYDANCGINRTTITTAAANLFPERQKQ